jgi:hypothetical protein
VIHHRHLEELEQALRLARRAVSTQQATDAGSLGSPGSPGSLESLASLARELHERWYLGLTSQQAEVPAAPARTWRAWGRLWAPETHDAADQVRLHLNVAPRTALHVLGVVTQRARGWQHPWLLTSTALQAELPTPESTVLLLPAAALLPLSREITELVADLRPFLALGVPALTLAIAPGASLSENPADGRSFGEHRCRIVARSVLGSMRCHLREQVARAVDAFARAGVDPERPYSEPGGTWDRPWRVYADGPALPMRAGHSRE